MDWIESILSSGTRASLVVAGGGSEAVHLLLSHPGASRFVLEAQVPYSPSAMFDYLGERMDSFCSTEAAGIMARRAYERAMIFTLAEADAPPILGIACTAALQTTRQRKGRDRAFICIKSRRRESMQEIPVPPGTRAGQESAVSSALLECIASFLQEPVE